MTLPSIYEDRTPPLESGGVVSRIGIDFQDHVATRFCLDMLDNQNITEVRCESDDDIAIVWNHDGIEEIEFVQAKGTKFNQLWSISLLCQKNKERKEGSTYGGSIYEKSLANDRYIEKSRFRIVTRRDVMRDLSLLKLPLNSPARVSNSTEFQVLCEKIENYSKFQSIKKNGSSYWVSNTLWDVEYSSKALQIINVNKLREYIAHQTLDYIPEQNILDIYNNIVAMVQKAALTEWEENPDDKKIKREPFIDWLNREILESVTNSIAGTGRVMQDKMEIALLPPDYILTAHKERKLYRRETLQPKYLDFDEREYLELEVISSLQQLRSELDAGRLKASGIEFHSICLTKLQEIHDRLPLKRQHSLGLLQGCMYYQTGRCTHRFHKVSL